MLLVKRDRLKIESHVVTTLWRDRPGSREIIARDVTHNLWTDTGDLYAAKKMAGQTVQTVTGMRYGTDATVPAKASTGAAIITYVTNSARVLDVSFPTVAMKDPGSGNGARITWQVTWPAGVASALQIAEMVLTNEASIGDTAGTTGNTVARALLSTPRDKDVDLNMTGVWYTDVVGA